MIYNISKFDNYTLIEVSGKIDRGGVISAASYIRELEINHPERVILDIDGLEDEREMFFHAALINTVKKEVEHGGGSFRIRAGKASIRSYLSMTGLERLFVFDENDFNQINGEMLSELQRC